MILGEVLISRMRDLEEKKLEDKKASSSPVDALVEQLKTIGLESLSKSEVTLLERHRTKSFILETDIFCEVRRMKDSDSPSVVLDWWSFFSLFNRNLQFLSHKMAKKFGSNTDVQGYESWDEQVYHLLRSPVGVYMTLKTLLKLVKDFSSMDMFSLIKDEAGKPIVTSQITLRDGVDIDIFKVENYKVDVFEGWEYSKIENYLETNPQYLLEQMRPYTLKFSGVTGSFEDTAMKLKTLYNERRKIMPLVSLWR